MLCDFQDGKCVRCGVRRAPPYPRRNCHPGLGDRVAAGLSAVGVTKERVTAVLGVRDCGCEQRQQLLNEIGYAVGIGKKPALADGDKPAE